MPDRPTATETASQEYGVIGLMIVLGVLREADARARPTRPAGVNTLRVISSRTGPDDKGMFRVGPWPRVRLALPARESRATSW